MGSECSCTCEGTERSGSTARERQRTTVRAVQARVRLLTGSAYLYGAHIGEGSLTQHIGTVFHEGVRKSVGTSSRSLTDILSVILDGEMLVWDPILEKYLAFGTLKTAASGKSVFVTLADYAR